MRATTTTASSLVLNVVVILHLVVGISAFASHRPSMASSSFARVLKMSSAAAPASVVPSWSDLKKQSEETPVGQALVKEVEIRKGGGGSAHVQNRLRRFGSTEEEEPAITLFRDHAGWCPYCQKTMLLIEEKEIPIKIELVPMRSYGDKPREFLQKVPSGLLPAIEVNNRIVTESQVIMELLDEWHQEGYKPMMPTDKAGMTRYHQLARLERELFSWWCTLVFRPEGSGGGLNSVFGNPFSSKDDKEIMSSSMRGFMDCLNKVNAELQRTEGPWFFGETAYPTMIDFIFVSHVERMLASCAFWKGLDLRDPQWKLTGLTNWLEAFERREHYLAFKSDYFTHVMDIPPQYGPGYDGGFEQARQTMSRNIVGRDGSWTLPLSFDDELQPLYKGPPLPVCVLESMDLVADADGTYESSDHQAMEKACRYMAGWKLAGNGINVSRFAARGGPEGARNPRKSFGAPLADPYADPDDKLRPYVDAALRVVCLALLDQENDAATHQATLQAAVPAEQTEGVQASLAYLRDRVGVPRDLPLAAARYLRAYLNWGIDALDQ